MLFALLLAQAAEKLDPSGTSWTNLLVPGGSAAAVITTVVIFLKQQRYMQNKYDASLKLFEQRLSATVDKFQQQVEVIVERAEKNEERRMGQIQNLFDKFMLLSTQMVQAMAELKHGLTRVEERLGERPKDKGS